MFVFPELEWPDPYEAMHVNGDEYRCWHYACEGRFKHGTRECQNCGRPQKYRPIKTESGFKCEKCDRILSSWLDAYYGKDPEQAKKCARCRK